MAAARDAGSEMMMAIRHAAGRGQVGLLWYPHDQPNCPPRGREQVARVPERGATLFFRAVVVGRASDD